MNYPVDNVDNLARKMAGKVFLLRAIPVRVGATSVRRPFPTPLVTLPQSELMLFSGPNELCIGIGAHSQLNIDLSGSFLFFLLKKYSYNWTDASTTPYSSATHPQRMQSSTVSGGCFKKLYEIVTTALQFAFGVGTNVTVVDRSRGFKNMLISFPGICIPRTHSDGHTGKPIPGICFRMIWDFRPRGRILSINDNNGIFLENCGHEVCPMKMCGNDPLVNGERLKHQGWDCAEKNINTVPLATSIFDIYVQGADHDALLRAFNSVEYQTSVTNQMKKYVLDEMTTLFDNNRDFSLDDLINMQHDQNEALRTKWNGLFEYHQVQGPPIGRFNVDPRTNHNLTSVWNDFEYTGLCALFADITV